MDRDEADPAASDGCKCKCKCDAGKDCQWKYERQPVTGLARLDRAEGRGRKRKWVVVVKLVKMFEIPLGPEEESERLTSGQATGNRQTLTP